MQQKREYFGGHLYCTIAKNMKRICKAYFMDAFDLKAMQN